MWGILVTDLFQFLVKMTMVTVLAFAAVHAAGGMAGLKTQLAQLDASRGVAIGSHSSVLSFVPDLRSPWMPMITFFVYISLNWWASWYPGAEPGGGGYVAQRMFCAKDEKHSLLATLWFNIAHFAIRPWPWILVALASLVLFPNLEDPETGYVRVMITYLPVSLRGVMLAAFAAAYMSTIATQLNWGASYIVNDFYRRFIHKGAPERDYVVASRWATVLLTLISIVVTFFMTSISGAWKLLLVSGAGTGLVLIARWYWWRINAWSEISAMIVAFVVSIALQTTGGFDSDRPVDFAWIMIITVAVTTVAWLAVTLLTPPEPRCVLLNFYRITHPSLRGWKTIAREAPEVRPSQTGWATALDWMCGCVLIYGILFGTGKIILGETLIGSAFCAVGLAAGFVIYADLSRRGWEAVVK
jgi:SSS family solute:Na+ symporter